MFPILFFIGAYLSGSIPTSYIITKLVKGIDIRQYGSGNPGATNVFRAAGPVPGAITLILDFLKGLIPVLLALKYFGHDKLIYAMIAGLFAVSGHIWTIFLKFRGGKGVATATGVFVALLPFPTLYAFILFLAVLFLSRYVSLSSMTAALFLPVFAVLRNEPKLLIIFSVLTAIVIIYKHKSNIKNLASGKERKIGRGT